MTLLIILLVIVLGLAVLLVVPRRPTDRERVAMLLRDDVDEELLEEAEDEVGGLDTQTTPEEAREHWPDWGPGVPKRHRATGD